MDRLIEWIDSRFNKWQLFYREVGLASTNSPIESYNARIKGDFTDRTFFNLVPAFKKLEKLVEFESLKEQKFSNSPSVLKSDKKKAQLLLKSSPEKIIKTSQNIYEVKGTKVNKSFVVDLIQMNCSCNQFFDRGSCKHLIACANLADKPLHNLPPSNKFHIRYRNRRKAQDYSENEAAELSVVEESKSSPSISNTNVQSPIRVIQNSPILIACSKRITRSQISKVVDLPKVTKIPNKRTIKQNTELLHH